MNGRTGQFNEWPKRLPDELIAISRVQDAIIKRHLNWLKRHKKVFDCTAWEMCGCTTVQFAEHFECYFERDMSWQNFGKWSVDHMFPLSGINPNKNEEIFAAFHFTNLRPVWLIENLKKGKRIKSLLSPVNHIKRYIAHDTFCEIQVKDLEVIR